MQSNNTNIIHELKLLSERWNTFPNLEVQGFYDPLSQTVHVNSMNKRQLEQLLETQDYSLAKQFFPLCTHELTHWLDHTSTLWGQKNLITIYNALNAWYTKDENEFWRIVVADSERRRTNLSTYYTEMYEASEQPWNGQPWRWKLSSGLEFSSNGKIREDRPIVFTRFSTSTNIDVCRIPFSISSLTETSARYAEIKTRMQNISSLEDMEKIIESNLFEKELIDYLYNPELTVYSVAAHCIANHSSIKDILKAYEFSSALANLCFNLPSEIFMDLKIPESFEIWGNRNQMMKELRDPGFAYLCISVQAPTSSDDLTVEDWLAKSLNNANLPSLQKIYELTKREMMAIEKDIFDGEYRQELDKLLKIGRSNYEKAGVYRKNVMSLTTLTENNSFQLPSIILGDMTLIDVGSNIINIMPEDIKSSIWRSYFYHKKIEEFMYACRQ